MKNQHDKCKVKKGANLLEVSRSNFYCFIRRKPSKRARETAEYLKKMKSIHEHSRDIYGHAGKKEGVICSRRRVAKIMRAHGIQAKTYKVGKKAAIDKTRQTVAPHYVNQKCTVDTPNQIWASDISYIATREGWLYVAVVLDLFFRKIVGFSMSTDLVKRALYSKLF